MFKKVSNVDLLNKLNNIENKIDIINLRLDSQTLEGCCDCKTREVMIYSQIKEYLEEKFNQFTITINENAYTNIEMVNTVFIKYRNDLLENLETVIENMKSLVKENTEDNTEDNIDDNTEENTEGNTEGTLFISENSFNKLLQGINLQKNNEFCDIIRNVEELHSLYLDKINQQSDAANNTYDILIKVDNKINMLYFENEIIKHQLLLEEELRKYNDEIDNLKTLIDKKINEINNTILYL
jgi:gas vesicle protein